MSTRTLMDIILEYKDELKKFKRDRIKVTHNNVFQKGHQDLFDVIDKMMDSLLLEGSVLKNSENLTKLLQKAKEGKKCIILPEHYSNFDYPIIQNLIRKIGEDGVNLSKRSIAVAGIKLSEDNEYISFLTDAYDRVYVYPGRNIANITDPEKQAAELQKCKTINIASMRQINTLREEGRVIIVFPTGTRYRPGKPETKRGMREIDSYIKSSDYMVLLSINGNCLEVNDSDDMTKDIVKQDKMILEASPVLDCAEFRESVLANLNAGEDRKQAVVDRVMIELEKMHISNAEE